MTCQGHKIGDQLHLRRLMSARERERERNRVPAKEWRAAVKSVMRQQMRDEAQKCRLVLGPPRFRERHDKAGCWVECTAIVQEVLRP